MPPKKKEVVEKKVILGRASNNLSVGLVGMPNVGKSSFFNVLTSCDLGKVANFPYATIDPEESRVNVPDERLDWLQKTYNSKKKIPAFLTCTDIAGLTRGASTGEGLGNAFLSHVRATDAIFQIVRAFEDSDITHVEGDVDPIRDMNIISNELRLKDSEWLEKTLNGLKKAFRGTGTLNLADKAKKEEIETVEKAFKAVSEDNMDVRKVNWSPKEIECINGLQLLTAKNVIYLVNLSEKDYVRKKNKWLLKIKAWVDENNKGDLIIPFSVALEERLAAMSPEEQVAETEKLGVGSGLGKIMTAGYQGLHLIRYFTAGPEEARAWTIRDGTLAPQAAGVIHGDFEKHFICAEIMSFADLQECGSEAEAKAAGKYMQKGKLYEMKDGDVTFFKHNA